MILPKNVRFYNEKGKPLNIVPSNDGVLIECVYNPPEDESQLISTILSCIPLEIVPVGDDNVEFTVTLRSYPFIELGIRKGWAHSICIACESSNIYEIKPIKTPLLPFLTEMRIISSMGLEAEVGFIRFGIITKKYMSNGYEHKPPLVYKSEYGLNEVVD